MLLDCSTVPVCIPVLDPNSEANCMCPCALFASPSPHIHVNSHPSYRCLPDPIPIAYMCLQPCGSILYK